MKIRSLTLLSVFLFVSTCEKEDLDYRLNYVGKYDFEIVKKSTTYVGGPGDGHFVSTTNYSFYSGSVKLFLPLSDLIRIDWGDETIDVEDGKVDQSRTIMTVDREGNLDCPEVQEGFGRPAFIHNDTIKFNLYRGGGMAHALGTGWHITGLKQ